MATAEWDRVALRDIASLDIERVVVAPDREYRLAGVLIAGRGVFWRGSIRGRDTTYATLHRLRAGQLVMRKLTAWEGPITTVPPEFDGGYVSSEFPTFTIDESQLLPEYMRLICQRPDFHIEMRVRSTGTAERRNRLKPSDLLSIVVALPPIGEQRSIVGALNVVDRVVGGYAAEREAARSLLLAAREELLGPMDVCQLGDVLIEIQAGKSPQAFDRPPEDGERGVLKVSAIRPGNFRSREAKAVPDHVVFPLHASVRRDDVLISRANTRQLVGSVCRVDIERQGLFLSDKTLRLVPDVDHVDPAFLVHALASSTAREQIERAATGTSESMKNISQRAISDIYVPMPDSLNEQRSAAATLDEIGRAIRKTQRLLECAQGLRAALLESLLSGDRRVHDGNDVVKELAGP